MITLNLPAESESITVTLSENRTLNAGYYLFVFTHIETKQTVTQIYNFSDDDSDYPDRYNLFFIETGVVFANRPHGFWRYEVYEQASSSNTDPEGLTEVERGIMNLIPQSAFAFEKYQGSTSFKAYAG